MATVGEALTPEQRTKLNVEDDWLTGQACTLDADGNVDPSCEACS